MQTLHLTPEECAALAACLTQYTCDLGRVDNEGDPDLAALDSIAAKLAATPPALDVPDTPEGAARLEAIGAAVVRAFGLQRIRYGNNAGRYRSAEYGTKTARGVGAIVCDLVNQGARA
jgi:hypothetical protein